MNNFIKCSGENNACLKFHNHSESNPHLLSRPTEKKYFNIKRSNMKSYVAFI